jgi:hypothetical protein
VEVERHSFGLDSDAIVDSFLDYSIVGGGEVRVLADLASGDLSGSVFYRTQSWVRCRSVSAAEIAAFLKSSREDQAKLYVSWKRREFEADLPRDRRLCARCKVAFKVFDNQWHQSGRCSRACLRASR